MRCLLPVLLALAAPAAAAAPLGPSFGLRPVGSAAYPVDAGAVAHGSVTVTNTGEAKGSVKLYTADATTGDTTGAVFLTDSAPTGVGTWITPGTTSLELDPGKHAVVAYTVHVPKAAKAGQYVGGIVGETVRKSAARNLSIVPVEIDVSGPQVARFAIGAVQAVGSAQSGQISIHVSNAGNVVRRPAGSVTVETPGGKALQTTRFKMGSFLPQTAIDYPLRLAHPLAPGDYVASVQLTFDGKTSSASPQFTVAKENGRVVKPARPTQVGPGGEVTAPSQSSNVWEWIAIGVIALLCAGAGYLYAVARKRRPVTVTATPVLTPPAEPPPGRPRCKGHHYWEVDWDHPETGPDGRVTHLHRCRNCGVEVRAHDIGDAAVKAAQLP